MLKLEKEKLFPGLFLEHGVIFEFEEMIFFVGVVMPELEYYIVKPNETTKEGEATTPFYMIPMIPPNPMKGVFPALEKERHIFVEDILGSGKKLLFGKKSSRAENIEKISSLGGKIIEVL